MSGVDSKVIVGSLFGLGLAALGGAAVYKHMSLNKIDSKDKTGAQIIGVDNKINTTITLIGDVGGTNVRYQLIELSGAPYEETKVIKQDKLKVADFEKFYKTIEHFLEGVEKRPTIGVIAIAGPVNNNTILMSNVQRWGQLDGAKLAIQLKMNRFVFINDFEANAYALMTLKDNDIIKLNGLDPLDTEHKLIIGPGTGLGTASLIAVPSINGKNQNFVAPGEGGHIGFAPSNETQAQFYTFLKKQLNKSTLVLESCFCGPAIPYMFKFFAQKYPQMQGHDSSPTAEQIMTIGVQKPESLHRKAVQLFLQIYENVICDELLTKLCYGGLFLIGSITKSVLPLIQNAEFGWLSKYQEKRPYLKHIFEKVPLIVIKQAELGQRGAFVYARKLAN